MSKYRLLGISGALRRDSTNTSLIHEAARLFDPAEFVVADLNLPVYDGDAEAAEGIPAAVQLLSEQILDADAVVISTPEYNKGLSGALKNALDWVSRTPGGPWKGKPVAVMSAAAGRAGGERGQAMLRQCLIAFQPRVVAGPEVHLADSGAQFGADGRLTGKIYIETLQALMDNLKAEIRG